MSVPARRTYDHRLRQLVTVAGPEAANDVELPRSTVATWRARGCRAVVSTEAFERSDIELRVRLARVERKLAIMRSLLRLVLVLVRVRGARLTDERLPSGKDKERILNAVQRASKVVSRSVVLGIVGLSESRLRAWKRRETLCQLDDKVSCPKGQPSRLTFSEQQVMRELVESHELRHFSIRALAMHAQRIGSLFVSESTWWRTIREKGWLRPRTRVHPESPKIGVRASAIGELLHVDVTVIRLLDGTKAFLQAVLDNFSRRILSWRISPALEPWRTGDLLKIAVAELRTVGACGTKLLADSGVENVNAAVDEALKETKVERILAQVEVAWSNSMIEAIWRKLKHDWLFLNRLDSFAAVERLVAFYIEQCNSVLPHSALKGRTPDEVFHGEAIDLPERLREAHRAAIQERIAVNRRLSCDECQVAARAREGSQELPESTRKVE